MAGIGIAKAGLGLLGKKKAPKIIRKVGETLSSKQKKNFKGPKFGKTLSVDKDALRISEINKKIRNTPRSHKQDVFEGHIDEVKAIYDKKGKNHIFKDYK